MSHRWISKFSALVLMALLTAGMAAGQAKKSKSASGTEAAITGSGCVEAGVEAGCLVLKDTKSGTLFNLFFKGTPPAINTAIRFTGKAHEGPTTCQQGTPVDVTKFTKIKMSCTAGSTKKK